MTDIGVQLDTFIIMFFILSVLNRGYWRLGLSTIFLILVGLRILLMYDIHLGKTLSEEDLKEQYPEIYYKLYATEEEKENYFGTKKEEEIMRLLNKAMKSDFQMMVEENPDTIVDIIMAFVWALCAIFIFIMCMRFI